MFWPKISRFTLRHIFIIHERLIHTVNDRLSALGAYAFGWTLVRTGYLTGSGRLVKNKKQKQKELGKYIFHKNHNIPPNINHKVLLFVLFK